MLLKSSIIFNLSQVCCALSLRRSLARLLSRAALHLDQPAFIEDTVYFPKSGSAAYDPYAPAMTGEWINPFPMPLCYGKQIEEATIDQLQGWFENRSLSSRQLVKCYMARIGQLNKWLNAVLEINPDALEIADRMDLERLAGRSRGPLHGIPFLIKDNIASKDKMETTAGSYALLGSVVPRDAHVVRLLREEGAVLLGKTNCDEWACMRNVNSCSSYSARGGRMHNAYNLTSHPWGSSGGSAQATTSNMAAFSLGTETSGSIIGPARRAGLVGIKPTVGLTSRAGIVPMDLQQDVVGPLARTVKDAVLALEVMVGVDKRDDATSALIGRVPAAHNYQQFLANKQALKGAVFGIPWHSAWMMPTAANDIQPLLALIDRLRSAGATIINGTEYLHPETSERPYLQSMRYRWDVNHFHDLPVYLSELKNTNIRSVQDVVQYNLEFNDVEGAINGTLPGFPQAQRGFLQCLATGGVRNQSYWENEEFIKRSSREEGIDAALTTRTVDGKKLVIHALLLSSALPQMAAKAGYPTITIPVAVSRADNVPIGLSLVGTAWSEPTLIKYASAIEDLIGDRPQPQFFSFWDRNMPREFNWAPL